MAAVTYPRRLHDLATEAPDEVALTIVDVDNGSTSYTRADLDQRAAAMARALAAAGVTDQSLVVLALPNGVDVVVVAFGAWWLGACILPLSTKLAPAEQSEVLAAAAESGRPITVVSTSDIAGTEVRRVDDLLASAAGMPTDPLTAPENDHIPYPGRALPSGGSTGRPKIIVDTRPLAAVPDSPNPLAALLGREPGQTTLVVGPVYHALPFGSIFGSIFDRGHVVLMTRFDAAAAVDAIEAHRVQVLSTVPIHLQRMAQLPDIDERDLSSVVSLYHSGASCAPWLKQRWFDLLGPEHVFEGFGSTEAVGMLVIRGDEWLEHPGSVGRGITTEIAIRDTEGIDLPVGATGDIYMRWRPVDGPIGSSLQGATYRYWGSVATTAPDGFVTVGDLGWLDDDGYLFVADRRVDMIITGGVNVYPAEVEAALSEYPDLVDVAVIGLSDDEWGRRVHAIVAARRPPDDVQNLVDAVDEWVRGRLSAAKRPKTYEVVAALPRNAAGKLRRGQLAAERAGSATHPAITPRREWSTDAD